MPVMVGLKLLTLCQNRHMNWRIFILSLVTATNPAISLARMIMDRAPSHMSRVYFGLSGSDANETNVKLAWHSSYTELVRLSVKRSSVAGVGNHGSGLVSGSLTGLAWIPRPISFAIARLSARGCTALFAADRIWR
jgi:adenosylmethionine-8-amino-7-oxononanoate aminotransferase